MAHRLLGFLKYFRRFVTNGISKSHRSRSDYSSSRRRKRYIAIKTPKQYGLTKLQQMSQPICEAALSGVSRLNGNFDVMRS